MARIKKEFQSLLKSDPLTPKIWNSRNLSELDFFLTKHPSCINEKFGGFKKSALSFVLCSSTCSLNLILLLLNHGADINGGDADGTTPLLVALAYNREEAIIRCLMENGADAAQKDENGQTSLCCAFEGGASFEILKLIAESGCHPDACNLHSSVLECVPGCSFHKLKDGVLDMLMNAGADMLRYGSYGESPVCLALRAGAELSDIQKLRRMGAFLDECKKHSNALLCAADFFEKAQGIRGNGKDILGAALNSDVIEILQTTVADPNQKNKKKKGLNPLQLTLKYGSYDNRGIKLMIDQAGVNLQVKDEARNNLLHLAAENYRVQPFAIKYLIERGLPVNDLNEKLQTPLNIAANKSDAVTIKLFIDHGAQVHNEDIFGKSPISVAKAWNRDDIVKLLAK